jgi:predicted homoserine dehydrogenase-like protein
VPIGLAHGVALARDVAEGEIVTEAHLAPRTASGPVGEALAMRAQLTQA